MIAHSATRKGRRETNEDNHTIFMNIFNMNEEVKGNEITLGFGYRLPKFKLPFNLSKKVSGNGLNLTADFSARRNSTIIRRLLEGVNQPTAGLNVYSIKAAADYAVSDKLNMRFFYEQTINTPVISTSYPTSNINTGIEIRFSLSQ
jgi:cell surface protein SprA